jgi:peptide deformylase
MPVRTILKWPNHKLSEASTAIESIDSETISLARDLFDTMAAALGAGLAATQLGITKSMCVIKAGLYVDNPMPADLVIPGAIVLVNPEIEILDEEMFTWREACLSVDDIEEEVSRHRKINIRYTDLSDNKQEFILQDQISGVVQHETDHLIGKVFIDRLSLRRQKKIKNKIFKRKQEELRELAIKRKKQKREYALENAQNNEVPIPGFRDPSKKKGKTTSKKKKTGKTYGRMKKRRR